MKDYTKQSSSFGKVTDQFDEGLRSHMIKVYNYMASGLGISGVVALLTIEFPQIAQLAMQMQWVSLIAILAMAFLVIPKMYQMSEGGALAAFYSYAGILSFAMSPIFLAYTGESLTRVFFITSGVFLGMSLFGYTTKKDLTSWGTFGMIGVWGVLIASIINYFLQSPAVHYIASAIAVVAAVALTAYDTQKIKQVYFSIGQNASMARKAAIVGALQLYFDFVYLFIHLLQFFGDRR